MTNARKAELLAQITQELGIAHEALMRVNAIHRLLDQDEMSENVLGLQQVISNWRKGAREQRLAVERQMTLTSG